MKEERWFAKIDSYFKTTSRRISIDNERRKMENEQREREKQRRSER